MISVSREDRSAVVYDGALRIAAVQDRDPRETPGSRPARCTHLSSEIALRSALADMRRQRFDDAAAALDSVHPASDVVHARSLECRGRIARVRGDYELATRMFLAALERLDACAQDDRVLEANCLRRLGELAVERLDAATWTVVARRRARFAWDAGGLGDAPCRLALAAASYACDVEGDYDAAAAEARLAERLAPTVVTRAAALCARAMVARRAGEPVSQRDHLRAALALFDRCDGAAPGFRLLALDTAQEASFSGFHAEARAAFARFGEPDVLSLFAHVANPFIAAHARFVEGQLLKAAGDAETACKAFESAFAGFRALTFTRRSVIAGIQIEPAARAGYYQGYISLAVERLPTSTWMYRAACESARRSVARRMTPTQRTLVKLVCDGRTNGEIAAARGKSEHTVRNQIARLFEMLEVRSRAELTALAIRQGFDGG